MEKLNLKKTIIISFVFLIVILSVILFPLLYSENWAERGQIGDTFNIVSSFSTLIACIIGLVTFIFYSQELIEQKREIDFTSKRQNEIEKSLSDISLTLKNNTLNSRKNLEIKSYLNIIEMKKTQIQQAKINGLTTTTISNLEIELNENISKLENLLKSI